MADFEAGMPPSRRSLVCPKALRVQCHRMSQESSVLTAVDSLRCLNLTAALVEKVGDKSFCFSSSMNVTQTSMIQRLEWVKNDNASQGQVFSDPLDAPPAL